jgi:pantoate--beta-alanine ligase
MRLIPNIGEMRLFSRKMKDRGKSIGLVPTMGALHEGHLSLVAAAQNRCDLVIVSIFVNPAQFGPNEDLSRYPRDLKKDQKLLSDLAVDILFSPAAGEIYPQDYKTYVEVDELSKAMCGRSRPSHFRGVATIITKLFNIINPDLAFFGEKDYQQLVIIQKLVRDLNLPVEIVSLPIVREYDGLAMSSRNSYLNPVERKKAVILYQALNLAKEMIQQGEKDARKVIARMQSLIHSESGVRIDYVCIVVPQTLKEVSKIERGALIALAVYIGNTRLIDNFIVS